MKIAIAGTRGIPNNYGGFEQFAEMLSTNLVGRGHNVLVYNASFHSYNNNSFKEVEITKKYCPENLLGGAAHFIYDFLCLKHAIKNKYDIVIMCGYGTSVWGLKFLNKKNTKIVVSMDGLEIKRKQYGYLGKLLLKWSEKVAVKRSDIIITDHPSITQYYNCKYLINSTYISYGAILLNDFDINVLNKYSLQANKYLICIARYEPDNQINEIYNAWNESKTDKKLVIVTNKHLKIKNDRVIIIKGLYNYNEIQALRHYSFALIHGHKAGGTNPSLLEAMAAKSLVIAHNNQFNKYVLGKNALFFSTKTELINCLNLFLEDVLKTEFTENNIARLKEDYTWIKVANDFEKVFCQIGK